ncbi:hypothetical protein I0C86_38215 [Plantactinospora sp. S1510]|uniref:Uncharacterized protein n=1 Tax=Plantactinospora alkalitolerans TaxID=2789879 RepID=A0ABS0H8C4_9ACTN|nr:hypothetical protein [Plantactinospora alkalitolerans]MBF9134725.1 hypothetical protein [Plantactinospora alkalitolerans]
MVDALQVDAPVTGSGLVGGEDVDGEPPQQRIGDVTGYQGALGRAESAPSGHCE